jgi:hypothetical protein
LEERCKGQSAHAFSGCAEEFPPVYLLLEIVGVHHRIRK